MIRAVVKNGIIQPLEPLPTDCQEGREGTVQERQPQPANGTDDVDAWLGDMKTLTGELTDPREWKEIEAALAEAGRQGT